MSLNKQEREKGGGGVGGWKFWTEMNDDLPARHTNTQVRIMDVNVISSPRPLP